MNFLMEGKLCDFPGSEMDEVIHPTLGCTEGTFEVKLNFGTEAFKFDLKSYLDGQFSISETPEEGSAVRGFIRHEKVLFYDSE